MAALQRTFTLVQVNGVTMGVGQDLHLDVPRFLDELLHIHAVIAERGLGLRADPAQRREDLVAGLD